MTLTLENITKTMGAETHIDDVSISLEPGSFNVLLGRTQAGKTTGLNRQPKVAFWLMGIMLRACPSKSAMSPWSISNSSIIRR